MLRSEIFFRTTQELEYFIFLSRKARFFSPQNLTLGYMTKTLNQIIFFFLHQNQNIFFSKNGRSLTKGIKQHKSVSGFKDQEAVKCLSSLHHQ